jgi:hypothetical protein
VQIPRPKPIGDASVAKQLRSVLFSESLIAATLVRPKGYRKVVLSHLLGWAGPFVARQATEPLPPTILYLAVTTVDIRLFSKPPFADPFEVGRWKKGAYGASLRESGLTLKLDLDVARWGRVTVTSSRGARPVLDLVVQGASGPAL